MIKMQQMMPATAYPTAIQMPQSNSQMMLSSTRMTCPFATSASSGKSAHGDPNRVNLVEGQARPGHRP
jgi:hypothetical protein